MQDSSQSARGFSERSGGTVAMASEKREVGDPAPKTQLAPPNCRRRSLSSMVFKGGQATVFISLNACR